MISVECITIDFRKNKVVRFAVDIYDGMVGETIYEYYAKLDHYRGGRIIHSRNLNYDQLKKIYSELEGKYIRTKFWSWMKEFSPEAEKQRSEDQYHDAISRVI